MNRSRSIPYRQAINRPSLLSWLRLRSEGGHRLQSAGTRIAKAVEAGADLLIVNHFGKRERDGKRLSYLIQRPLDADIPVVIAVSQRRFADWIVGA